MVKFSLADRKLDVLRRPIGNSVEKFSPDGKYVAFVAPNNDGIRGFILSLADNSVAEVDPGASAEDITWIPDGSQVVFVSNRSGRYDLWAIAIRDGKPAGAPRMVYAGSGDANLNGWRDADTLGFNRIITSGDFYALRMDGGIAEPKAVVPAFFQQHAQSLWSPDGKEIAILVDGEPSHIEIYNLETRLLRHVRTDGLRGFHLAGWPTGSAAPLVDSDLGEGHGDLQRLSFDAAPVRLMLPNSSLAPIRISRDGSVAIFIPRNAAAATLDTKGFQVYDLKHRQMLKHIDAASGHGPWQVAPDGRSMVYAAAGKEAGTSKLVRVSLTSGVSQTIADGLAGQVRGVAIASDGRIAFATASSFGPRQTRRLFVIAAAGGEPQEVPIPAAHKPGELTWSPDGKQLGYVSYDYKAQFFTLSNFLGQ